MSFTEYYLPDEETELTATGNVYTYTIDSCTMLDNTNGITELYKVPVDITLDNTVISFGSDDIHYTNEDATTATDQQNGGWWAITIDLKDHLTWNTALSHDMYKIIGWGFVAEYIE